MCAALGAGGDTSSETLLGRKPSSCRVQCSAGDLPPLQNRGQVGGAGSEGGEFSGSGPASGERTSFREGSRCRRLGLESRPQHVPALRHE
ncbi:unnamed protein product [Rangifer tarandus platyrhynchus]|uniref:Uncharacterized protein n=1 Tax=Rangifer tarandus platyrhynchus TaxID=3082113 RepID=A0AC59YAL5_RANTA